jgi:hypothetical protein
MEHQKKSGRKPMGERPMTNAERMAKTRAGSRDGPIPHGPSEAPTHRIRPWRYGPYPEDHGQHGEGLIFSATTKQQLYAYARAAD